MDPLGILLYGYSKAQSEEIGTSIAAALGREVDLLSASGMEEKTVDEILEAGGSAGFEEREDRVLMFLGFDDEAISRAIDGFPKEKGIVRPIFCGLTDDNVQWKFTYLLEHLLEEHRHWTSRKENGAAE